MNSRSNEEAITIMILHNLLDVSSSCIHQLFHFQSKSIEERVKYLIFMIKENEYIFDDWIWLYKKVEKPIAVWNNKLLSRGGRLVIIKWVVEIFPVYWTLIALVLK